MRIQLLLTFVSGISLGVLRPGPEPEPEPAPVKPPPVSCADSVDELLLAFVEDYKTDASARPMVFGIEVRDALPSRWKVVVEQAPGGELDVILDVDFPDEPAAYFTTDMQTLGRIYRGELGSLTAMGKAFSTDFAPLDMDTMPGYAPDEAAMEHLIKLGFHFWTRGYPERVPFGTPESARPLHGAHGALFYYQPGFRSGYFMIAPGEHANEDPRSQSNPFPTLLVVTKGSLQARIGDTECVLKAGEAIHVGPDVRHEFWVDEDASEGGEGVLLMFGEGA